MEYPAIFERGYGRGLEIKRPQTQVTSEAPARQSVGPTGVVFDSSACVRERSRKLNEMPDHRNAVHTAFPPADASDDAPGPQTVVSVDQVLDCLENMLRQSSTDWRTAVLMAIGRWPTASEVVDGERYDYLLAGEAFDWKLLAQRIWTCLPNSIPQDEWGSWISSQSRSGDWKSRNSRTFSEWINTGASELFLRGNGRTGLVTAVGEEIAKGRVAGGRAPNQESRDDAYLRLYGSSQKVLWYDFIASKEADKPESPLLSAKTCRSM